MKVTFNKEGLTGDELVLIEKIEKRMKDLPDAPEKEILVKEIRSSLKGLLKDDGTPAIPFEKLAELLGEDDKGIRSILKKQGEDITALKEKEGEKKVASIRSVLKAAREKVETLYNGHQAGAEIKLDVRAAVVMTTGNTVTGHDDLPTDLIESFSEGQFVAKRQPREYVYDLANVTNVAEIEKYITWMEEGDVEGAFAIVAEGGLKPLISASLVRNHSEARKAAGKYVVTEEFTKFYKRAYEIIQRIIRQQILRDKADILTVDLLADAAPYTASALDGAFPADDVTDYHAIAAVAAQIESLNFSPDMLLINPQDKWRIGMAQASDGHFYLPNVPIVDPTGNLRILGFIVRTSNKIPVGNFLLGESGLWEIVQEGITVRMGYGMTVTGGTSNGGGNVTDVQGDLDHNRFRVIVEQYFHNYIATNNEGSFVYAEFDTVKAALEEGAGS